jgi:hypothetical protein
MGASALALAGTPKGFARIAPGHATSSPGAWTFGVMNDTQWTVTDDGYDPATCAVGILKQIQRQFIANKVKFVVHVGDLCDSGALPAEDIRALYAQPLYDHGIGFFPLRGNHDDGAPEAAEFQALYPQTQNGIHNATPAAKFDYAAAAVISPDNANLGIPAMPDPGSSFQVGVNLSSPDPTLTGNLVGLSYSFDFENARFILLDQFTPAAPATAGLAYNLATAIATQQPWITAQLQNRQPGSHAFVFSHKGLVTCQHADVLFGNSPDLNPALTNQFINSLASNGVRYLIHGHDHMYDRSFVTNTTGTAKVTQILTSSNSSKFYVPAGSLTNSAANGGKSNDDYYDLPAFGIRRRQPLAQQLNSIGFQIVTVDGANITVDYYAAIVSINMSLGINTGATSELEIPGISSYTFTKQETFGYSQVGREFVVAAGGLYTVVQDNSGPVAAGSPTIAQILSGVASKATDANGVSLAKAVNTGWKARADAPNSGNGGALASDVLFLWGMGSALGSDETDTFTLSMSYESAPRTAGNGGFGIASLDANGDWVNAVERNTGGTAKFVAGPWQSSYGLGTYGIDAGSKTVWAVINCNGQFAVANEIEDLPGLTQ